MIQLNHTIVSARDALACAQCFSDILGLREPVRLGPFWAVSVENGVTLDFQDWTEQILIEHYAFLVSQEEFAEIFERIRARAWRHWADPTHLRPFESNCNDGGRGVDWNDPNRHYLEINAHPYGGGG
jgi:hypothetical protein